MRNTFSKLVVIAALALVAPAVMALASDRDQPMNIEADSLRHDEGTQETVFSGGVVVTKGSIVLRGDTLTVRQRDDGSQLGIVQAADGQRAFFSQQRDTVAGAPVERVEAQARRIEYDSRADRVSLFNQAVLRRYQAETLNDELTGAEIIYHNATGVFTVDGGAASGGGKGGRVRAVIGATTTGNVRPGTGGSAATPLTPSTQLQDQ